MKKIKFAIIGNPISHSLSPIMHNYWFNKYNIDAEYELLNVTENQVQDVINKIKDKEIKGINVTLPYKKFVIPYLNRTINDAKDSIFNIVRKICRYSFWLFEFILER